MGDANEGEPNDEEIASALDLSIAEVRDTLLKRLADPDQEQPDEIITRSSSQKQLVMVLEGLDEREHSNRPVLFRSRWLGADDNAGLRT